MEYIAICQPLDGSNSAKVQWCASAEGAEKILIMWQKDPPFDCPNLRFTIARSVWTIEG